jgi:hypothetical protein
MFLGGMAISAMPPGVVAIDLRTVVVGGMSWWVSKLGAVLDRYSSRNLYRLQAIPTPPRARLLPSRAILRSVEVLFTASSIKKTAVRKGYICTISGIRSPILLSFGYYMLWVPLPLCSSVLLKTRIVLREFAHALVRCLTSTPFSLRKWGNDGKLPAIQRLWFLMSHGGARSMKG